MDRATLKALNGSIAKWRRIAAGKGVDKGTTNCPLCQEFYNFQTNCKGCPVSTRTGLGFCGGSPYTTWTTTEASDWERPAKTAEEKKLAQAELDFLISLRPTKRMEKSSEKVA